MGEARQAQKVHEFFLGLYRTAAEPLPHEHYMVRGSVDNNIEITEKSWRFEEVQEFDEDDEHTEIWNPDRSVVDDFAAFLGDEVGLARRFLPHSKLTTLFWLMNSTMEQEAGPDDEADVPSWSVFYCVWKQSWEKHLLFRKSSQHADCKICFECREQMHKSGLALRVRLDMARQWRQHLRDAYHDRMIYWWCRYASRHSMDVLTIIIDSMDKAKFAWPQYPWGRADKALESFHRPRLVVTGGLAHGYATFLYIAEDTVSHGASAFCDVLSRMLEVVYAQCKAKGVAFPRHLVVQSDNTTAQAKNQHVAKFLAYLVGRYKFATANLFFLPVGHTHEDIGSQLFAAVALAEVLGFDGFLAIAGRCTVNSLSRRGAQRKRLVISRPTLRRDLGTRPSQQALRHPGHVGRSLAIYTSDPGCEEGRDAPRRGAPCRQGLQGVVAAHRSEVAQCLDDSGKNLRTPCVLLQAAA